MTTDRTTRAKRALELSEKATEGPWRSMRDGNQWSIGRLVGASRIEELPRPFNPNRAGGDPRHMSRFLDDDGDFIAESRTLLPALARDVLELEAILEARDSSCVWEDCRAEALYCADHAVTFARQMASGPPLASLVQRIAELEAERERMREALARIATASDRVNTHDCPDCYECIGLLGEIMDATAAALTPAAEDSEKG